MQACPSHSCTIFGGIAFCPASTANAWRNAFGLHRHSASVRQTVSSSELHARFARLRSSSPIACAQIAVVSNRASPSQTPSPATKQNGIFAAISRDHRACELEFHRKNHFVLDMRRPLVAKAGTTPAIQDQSVNGLVTFSVRPYAEPVPFHASPNAITSTAWSCEDMG